MTSELRTLAVTAMLALAPLGTAGQQIPVIRPDAEPVAPFVAEVFFTPPSAATTAAAECDSAGTPSTPGYRLNPGDRDIIAACLVLEAACQGDFGMRGVMAVIRNRAGGNPELFAPAVLRKFQFSALNGVTSGRESAWRAIERAKQDRMWGKALEILDDASGDSWYDPTAGATHYTRTGEQTRWTRSLSRTTIIGAHSFYR